MTSLRWTATVALLGAVAVSCGGGDGITVASEVVTVSVSPASATVAPNGTMQLTATALDDVGNIVTGESATWASNNLAVATVSPSGLVTGAAVGTATIRATIRGKTGSATITVAVPQFTLTIAGAGNGTGTVTAPANAGGGAINVTSVAGALSGTWEQSYASGTIVSLTATPAAGSVFTGWSGSTCSGIGGCNAVMSQAQFVTATFALANATNTTSVSPAARNR